MNNEEVKATVKIYLNQYHNSIFNIELTENQLEDIFISITNNLLISIKNESN